MLYTLWTSEGLGLSPGAWGAPKRGMPTGTKAFLELPIALGFGPATGPTLKTALCHIRTLVGRRINTVLFLITNCFTNCLLFVSCPLKHPIWGMPMGLKVFWDFAGHVVGRRINKVPIPHPVICPTYEH